MPAFTFEKISPPADRGPGPPVANKKHRGVIAQMLDRFAARPMDVPWPEAANFPMTGRHWSRLQFKHLDHHLKPFGA